MRVFMDCPRCGKENARALQHCWSCGLWLHGSSPVVAVCPQCRMAVRESEIVCANCGIYLDREAREEGKPLLPEEKALGARARRAVAAPARATARLVSAAFLFRVTGTALFAVAAGRGVLIFEQYRAATTPDEALFSVYGAVLWGALGVVGLILLMVGVFTPRAQR